MNAPSPPSGGSEQASWLTRLLRFCKANQILAGAGYGVKRGSEGTTLDIYPSAAGGGGWHFASPREYDSDQNYSEDEVVVVSPTNPAVTDGVPIADGSDNDYSIAGTYVCVKGPTTVIPDPELPDDKIIHIPEWPQPADTEDDPVYWVLIAFYPTAMEDCIEGEAKTFYHNAQPRVDHTPDDP